MEETVLKFDFELDEEADYQAICLDYDTELSVLKAGDGKPCFAVANTQGWLRNVVNSPHMTAVGEKRSYEIPVGYFFTGDVNYLGFIQDSDTNNTWGYSAFSNIKIVDDAPVRVITDNILQALSQLTNGLSCQRSFVSPN